MQVEKKKKTGKLTGRWKREMRKYRSVVIWRAILVDCLAITLFTGACIWVREKMNIEIKSYFDDRRTQVQDWIISILVDDGTPNKEKYINPILEETDRYQDTDGFSFSTVVYENSTMKVVYENPEQTMDPNLEKFVGERSDDGLHIKEELFQTYISTTKEQEENGGGELLLEESRVENVYGRVRGDYLRYASKVIREDEVYYVQSAMYANPFTWYPQIFRLIVIGGCGCVCLLLGSLVLTLLCCRKKKARLMQRQKNEELMLAIAHDIRGPLMAIGGYAENMGQLIEAEEGRHYRDEILSNVSYMNTMITNIICYLKDREADKSEKSAVSIREIFEKKAAQYQDLIDKNKLTIAICGDVKLQTDAKMFGYIADNLVTNAVKYAKPETEVQIRIDKDSVTVRNQAEHIPDCEPEELWNPTKTGDAVRTGRNGGGMGLGIVRRFLEACGYTGEIRMEGDVFEVIIDLR